MDKVVMSFTVLQNRAKLRPSTWAYKIQRNSWALTVTSFKKFPNMARYSAVRDIILQTWPS